MKSVFVLIVAIATVNAVSVPRPEREQWTAFKVKFKVNY